MKVGIVGLGVIGKRVAAAISTAADLTLVGACVRSIPSAYHNLPNLLYFTTTPAADIDLLHANARVGGSLRDLLSQVEVVVDAGTAGTGAQRAAVYAEMGIRVIFCGGERRSDLGPLVHPAFNFAVASRSRMVRLASCNTTGLARFVAAVTVAGVDDLDVTVLGCSTDNDKAAKGITNGAFLKPHASHHAQDLRSMASNLSVRSKAAIFPMTCGHVLDVRLRTSYSRDEILDRLRGQSRITLMAADAAVDTAQVKAAAARVHGRPWGQRFELLVVPSDVAGSGGGNLQFWLSLDNESITMPELLDVLRAKVGGRDLNSTQALTDTHLGISRATMTVPVATVGP